MNREQLYESPIGTLVIGRSMVGKKGTILEPDHPAERLTGYSREEVLGKSTLKILHDSLDRAG